MGESSSEEQWVQRLNRREDEHWERMGAAAFSLGELTHLIQTVDAHQREERLAEAVAGLGVALQGSMDELRALVATRARRIQELVAEPASSAEAEQLLQPEG